MKNELIKVTTNENGQKLVGAKELYLGLGLNKSNWTKWYPKNIQSDEFFKENEDWAGFVVTTNGNQTVDFAISIEFAKHLAMQSRTEKSHEYRNYFIKCEKQLIENQSKSSLLLEIYNGGQGGIIASKKLTEIEVAEATKPLLEAIEEQKPMVEFAIQVSNASNSIDMGQFAKLVKDEKISIGRNRLFDWMRDNKFLDKNNVPYQSKIEQGLFEVNEYTYRTAYGKECVGIKTLITGKGQIYFVEKLRKEY